MTLARGDKVVKLDAAGKPMTIDNPGEVYVEYEVEEITPYFQGLRRRSTKVLDQPGTDLLEETHVIAMLRKLR